MYLSWWAVLFSPRHPTPPPFLQLFQLQPSYPKTDTTVSQMWSIQVLSWYFTPFVLYNNETLVNVAENKRVMWFIQHRHMKTRKKEFQVLPKPWTSNRSNYY